MSQEAKHGFVLNFNTIFYATVVLCLAFRNTDLCYFYFLAFKLIERNRDVVNPASQLPS